MKVTACQMRNDPSDFVEDWKQLIAHVQAERSDFVLLPELPFSSWFPDLPLFDSNIWNKAIASHEEWLERLADLAPASIIGTRPTQNNGERCNEAFLWRGGEPIRDIHQKRYLPNEDGFWEPIWYGTGDEKFQVAEAGGVRIGVQICTEIWMNDRSRAYGREGAHLIVVPRCTPVSSNERWIVAGRMAALSAGAYCLSSNRAGQGRDGLEFGGLGWVIDPNGDVLAATSVEEPFVSVAVDLAVAEKAKTTYPRYVT